MGFLTRFLGGHNLPSDRTLQPTDSGAFSPDNPGDMGTIRTVPVLQQPRYFGEAEARAIRQLAEQRGIDLKNTQDVYQALQAIEAADLQLHQTHRGYQTQIAQGELKRKQVDVQYTQTLHGLRPAYADLSSGLRLTVEAMDRRVAELTSKIKGWL